MAAAIITALVIALVSVGVAGFQSLKGDMRDLKGDMRDMEVRLSENIIAVETRLSKAIVTTETRLSADIAASEARQQEGLKDFKQDLRDFKAEVRADNRALNDKLDRVLENLPATKG